MTFVGNARVQLGVKQVDEKHRERDGKDQRIGDALDGGEILVVDGAQQVRAQAGIIEDDFYKDRAAHDIAHSDRQVGHLRQNGVANDVMVKDANLRQAFGLGQDQIIGARHGNGHAAHADQPAAGAGKHNRHHRQGAMTRDIQQIPQRQVHAGAQGTRPAGGEPLQGKAEYGSSAFQFGLMRMVSWSYGGDFIDLESGDAAFDTEPVQRAMDFFNTLLVEDESAPIPGTEGITTDRVAMNMWGPWASWYIMAEVEFDWDVVPIPMGTEEVVLAWGSTIAAFASSEHQD